jgi:ankyrin repeat protein
MTSKVVASVLVRASVRVDAGLAVALYSAFARRGGAAVSLKSRKLSPEVLARRIDPVKGAALHAAIGADRFDEVAALLAAGASPASSSADGLPALYVAALGGSAAIVTCLLDSGADIDAIANGTDLIDRQRYETSATALMGALRAGREEVALLLLERGASIDPIDRFSRVDALFFAAESGLERAVESILRRGPARQTQLFGTTRTALDAAVEGGHVGIVRRLLAAGFRTTSAADRIAAGPP